MIFNLPSNNIAFNKTIFQNAITADKGIGEFTDLSEAFSSLLQVERISKDNLTVLHQKRSALEGQAQLGTALHGYSREGQSSLKRQDQVSAHIN